MNEKCNHLCISEECIMEFISLWSFTPFQISTILKNNSNTYRSNQIEESEILFN